MGFRIFPPPPDEAFVLMDLEAEVRLLEPGDEPGDLQVDF